VVTEDSLDILENKNLFSMPEFESMIVRVEDYSLCPICHPGSCISFYSFINKYQQDVTPQYFLFPVLSLSTCFIRRSNRLTVHATSGLDNNVWPVVVVAESNPDVACTVNLFDLLMMDTERVRNM
jgi:hypothetical protein